MTDHTGALVQRTIHTPYGRQHAMLDGAGAPLGHSASTARNLFTDQEYDPESELSYYGARYYDPIVGRFLSRDPALAGPAAGITFQQVPAYPQASNQYAYALNSPGVVFDPTGESPVFLEPARAVQHELPPPKKVQEAKTKASFLVGRGGLVSFRGGGSAGRTAAGGVASGPSAPSASQSQSGRVASSTNYAIAAGDGEVHQAGAFGSLASWLARLGARVLPYIPAAATLGYNLARLRLDQALTKPTVFNPAAQRLVGDLFRLGDRIPGGTAGAIRHTARTGELVGGTDHLFKGVQSVNRITNLLQSGRLGYFDRQNLTLLQRDLLGALGEL